MTKDEIEELLQGGAFPCVCKKPELVETHISWVILCDEFAFKIKKAVRYSFLDFSTITKRLYFCEREVLLNSRQTQGMYLDVVSIKKGPRGIGIDTQVGDDYAVRMRKQDCKKQMDVLLSKNEVTFSQIEDLAKALATFHKKMIVVSGKDPLSIMQKFNNLECEVDYLTAHLGSWSKDVIEIAIHRSNTFLRENRKLFASRMAHGFFRDVHGDLHSANVFMLPEPIIFDCIEFNDGYRQIDVLDEVAFLCMDIDAFGKGDLSELLIRVCLKTKIVLI